MDLEEAYRPAETIDSVISAFVIVGILTAGLGIGLFWRNQMASYYRSLYKTQEFLGENLERYRVLAETTRDIILFVRRDDGRILEANKAAIAAYGYTHDELLEMNIRELRSPEEFSEMEEQIKQADAGWIMFEARHIRKDGSLFPVEVNSSGTTIKEERLLCSVVRDITKRKQDEEEREKLFLELKESLANVKTLSGMLPICASCKKIRDDKGYWKQVESYVSEHTEAVFSHGICPECAKKAYEELEKFKKDSNL